MSTHVELLRRCREQDTAIVVIGASAGGVDALKRVLSSLKNGSHLAVLVVIHIPSQRPSLIPDLMKEYCTFAVKEATSAEKVESDTIYFAPPDYHLSLERNQTLSLSSEDPLNFSRPSIDILFESAAYSYGKRVMGVILTGANDDGARGLELIQKMGGITLIQSPLEAEYPTMPRAALDRMKPDAIMEIKEMRSFFEQLTRSVA